MRLRLYSVKSIWKQLFRRRFDNNGHKANHNNDGHSNDVRRERKLVVNGHSSRCYVSVSLISLHRNLSSMNLTTSAVYELLYFGCIWLTKKCVYVKLNAHCASRRQRLFVTLYIAVTSFLRLWPSLLWPSLFVAVVAEAVIVMVCGRHALWPSLSNLTATNHD